MDLSRDSLIDELESEEDTEKMISKRDAAECNADGDLYSNSVFNCAMKKKRKLNDDKENENEVIDDDNDGYENGRNGDEDDDDDDNTNNNNDDHENDAVMMIEMRHKSDCSIRKLRTSPVISNESNQMNESNSTNFDYLSEPCSNVGVESLNSNEASITADCSNSAANNDCKEEVTGGGGGSDENGVGHGGDDFIDDNDSIEESELNSNRDSKENDGDDNENNDNNDSNANAANGQLNCGTKPDNLQEWLHMFHGWSNNERLAAFDALVSSEICDVQQIRYLMGLIEPQLQRDFISLLPKELSLYVLSFLEPKDLLRVAQTCRYWRVLCEDNLLWREKCAEEGLLDDNETLSDLFRRRIHSKIPVSPISPSPSGSSNNKDSCSTFVRSEYKLAYLKQKSIEHNWRYGRFPGETESSPSNANTAPSGVNAGAVGGALAAPPAPVNNSTISSNTSKYGRYMKEILHLKGHDDHVITCLQFNPASNLIVSGSDDNTLKVWSSMTGKCLRTLTGHTGGVWSSQLSPTNIVISGSTDRTLKVWDAINGECLHTLYGHTSTVRCMSLHGNHVVSGSRDATLRVWDITSGECQHVLVGHMAAVRCVQFNGKIVVSGAYDYVVKVWDVATETCLHTLEGHTNRVYSLQFDGENIVSGSLDTSIRVWSASTGSLKHTLIGHQSLTSGMQLRGNILVSGNADSTVKVWDINTGQCLQTLAGPNKHQSAVTCLQFNSRFVITSSDDGTVKLWDLRTGDFIRNLVTLSSGGSGGVVWRIRASNTKLVCAVGSRNGTEETKLLVLDFDPDEPNFEQALDIPFTC